MANDDYKVGYKKPPVETQFQPGQSGNRSGRPKGTVRINDIVTAELNSLIPLTENGIDKSVPKLEAVVKALVANAIKGDVKAAKEVLKLAAPAEEEAFRKQSEYDMKKVDEAYAIANEIIDKWSKKPRCPLCNVPGFAGDDAPAEVPAQNVNEIKMFPETGEIEPGLTKWYPPFDPSTEIEID
jgi:hypothetical protein